MTHFAEERHPLISQRASLILDDRRRRWVLDLGILAGKWWRNFLFVVRWLWGNLWSNLFVDSIR